MLLKGQALSNSDAVCSPTEQTYRALVFLGLPSIEETLGKKKTLLKIILLLLPFLPLSYLTHLQVYNSVLLIIVALL